MCTVGGEYIISELSSFYIFSSVALMIPMIFEWFSSWAAVDRRRVKNQRFRRKIRSQPGSIF